MNTVIVDFRSTNDLKTGRNLACKLILNLFLFLFYLSNKESTEYHLFLDNIIVRTPSAILNSNPIDTSFISYKHPGI